MQQNLTLNSIKLIMHNLQSKITQHIEKQENMTHNYSTETDSEIIELADNEVKTDATNMFHMMKDI